MRTCALLFVSVAGCAFHTFGFEEEDDAGPVDAELVDSSNPDDDALSDRDAAVRPPDGAAPDAVPDAVPPPDAAPDAMPDASYDWPWDGLYGLAFTSTGSTCSPVPADQPDRLQLTSVALPSLGQAHYWRAAAPGTSDAYTSAHQSDFGDLHINEVTLSGGGQLGACDGVRTSATTFACTITRTDASCTTTFDVTGTRL